VVLQSTIINASSNRNKNYLSTKIEPKQAHTFTRGAKMFN